MVPPFNTQVLMTDHCRIAHLLPKNHKAHLVDRNLSAAIGGVVVLKVLMDRVLGGAFLLPEFAVVLAVTVLLLWLLLLLLLFLLLFFFGVLLVVAAVLVAFVAMHLSGHFHAWRLQLAKALKLHLQQCLFEPHLLVLCHKVSVHVHQNVPDHDLETNQPSEFRISKHSMHPPHCRACIEIQVANPGTKTSPTSLAKVGFPESAGHSGLVVIPLFLPQLWELLEVSKWREGTNNIQTLGEKKMSSWKHLKT